MEGYISIIRKLHEPQASHFNEIILESNTDTFQFVVEFRNDYRMYVLDIFQGLSDEFNKKYKDCFEIQEIKDDWIFFSKHGESNCLPLSEKGLYYFFEITGYNINTNYEPYTTTEEYHIIKCKSTTFQGTLNQKTKEILKYETIKNIAKNT